MLFADGAWCSRRLVRWQRSSKKMVLTLLSTSSSQLDMVCLLLQRRAQECICYERPDSCMGFYHNKLLYKVLL